MSTSPGSPSTPSLQGYFSRSFWRDTQHLISNEAAGRRVLWPPELARPQSCSVLSSELPALIPQQALPRTLNHKHHPPSPSGEPSLTDYLMRPRVRLRVFRNHAPKHQGCSRNRGKSTSSLHSPELLQPFQSSPSQVRISCFEAKVSSEVCSFVLKETCSTKSSVEQCVRQRKTHHLPLPVPTLQPGLAAISLWN